MSTSNPYKAPQSPRSATQVAPANTSLTTTLFSFSGRIPRRVYWGVSIAVGLVFMIFVKILMLIFGEDSTITIALAGLAYLPVLWISLAVVVKRWHDRGKSGWWIFIGLIPIIGAIWAFVEVCCLRGTEGPNSYGPDPT
jgi:uncharacterized membrane protein YhaH (DUF805 family)